MLKRMGTRTDYWGTSWFSMDIDVVLPLIKDVSHASAMSVILISCRRLISMQWLVVSKLADKSSIASTEP